MCAALALQHCSVRSLHTGHAVRALPPKPGDEDAAGDRVETEVQVDADGSPFKHGGSARPEMETIYTVPNMLTMARMVASPIIGAAVLTGHYDWAVAGAVQLVPLSSRRGCLADMIRFAPFIPGFVVAGALDWLDGWVARKFDMTVGAALFLLFLAPLSSLSPNTPHNTLPCHQSTLGSLLDPVADKVLVACLVVPMTYQGLLYLPLVALVVTRDVGLVAGAFYHRAVTKPKDVGFFDVAHGASFSIQPSLISKVLKLLAVATAPPPPPHPIVHG